MAKTPVSVLQELMAARGCPLPVYIEAGFGTAFKCCVKVADIEAVGCGTTKKAAKHESAKNALEKLRISERPHSPAVEKPLKNYVGQLNEFSTKNGLGYPEYHFVTATLDGSFLMECKFLNREVTGVGCSKKDAKQEAARKMLELFDSGVDYKSECKEIVPKPTETHTINEIVNIFNTFSFEAGARSRPVVKLEASSDITVDDQENDVEILERQLEKFNIKFTIHDLQKSPHVLCLIIRNTDFTFMSHGNTREEVLAKVYKQVLAIKATGCSLDDSLTSFS